MEDQIPSPIEQSLTEQAADLANQATDLANQAATLAVKASEPTVTIATQPFIR